MMPLQESVLSSSLKTTPFKNHPIEFWRGDKLLERLSQDNKAISGMFEGAAPTWLSKGE
jgi:hypothetical protein